MLARLLGAALRPGPALGRPFRLRALSTDLTGSLLPKRAPKPGRAGPKEFVSLSQRALGRLHALIAGGDKVVYLSLRVKGCNGYAYEMSLVERGALSDMDERVYDPAGRLVLAIENKASFYLLGSRIDYAEDDLTEGFTFDNPNVSSKCGCGKSFRF